jgi:hypothetical protein
MDQYYKMKVIVLGIIPKQNNNKIIPNKSSRVYCGM